MRTEPYNFDNITPRGTTAVSWPRSVVKYVCQSGQAIKLFQITPYVSDLQTLENPGS